MNPVNVRNVKIGEGIPKICVPIVGVTAEEIINEARAIAEIPADIVEWRADWYEDVFEFDKVEKLLARLREILGEMPILFTFRTAGEGGEKEIDKEKYFAINKQVTEQGVADLVDVEVFIEETTARAIIDVAHQNCVKVVASNHDFQKTPEKAEIIQRLGRMQEMGADILKIAVMPQCEKDVLTLLEATEEMFREHATQPIVTMSMSGKGAVSRLTGEVFGSAITFGSARQASAPGQIPVHELKAILSIIHRMM